MSDQTREHTESLRVAITGASGMIGGALQKSLRASGHTIHRLTRRPPEIEEDIYWKPSEGELDADRLEGVDVVVHLAGENLFGLWTAKKKQKIVNSRVDGTGLIAEAIAGLSRPPSVFVSASAVGIYGDSSPEIVDESAPVGDTFIADVCKKWEAACAPATHAGIRTVNTRLGVVLSPIGGALKVMLTPFKLGLGASVGDGQQFLSWVTLDDVVRGVRFVIGNASMHAPALEGPVNLTSPNPVTNAELTEVLGDVLGRPTLFKLPSPVVKLGAGQMGEEMLLHGQRAVPRRLQESGFEFAYPELEAALSDALES